MHILQRVIIRNKSNILTLNSSVPLLAIQFNLQTVNKNSFNDPKTESNAMNLATKERKDQDK